MESKINYKIILSFALGFLWLFLGSIFFMIPMVVIGAKANGLSILEFSQNEELLQSASTVCSCVSHLLGITIFVNLYKNVIKSDGVLFKNKLLKNLLIIVIGFILLFASNYLMSYIYTLLGFKEDDTSKNQEIIINILNSDAKIYMILYSGILAPILEEVVFRKLFYTMLKENTKLPTWLIVLIISIVFAFIHVSDSASLVYFPQYFVLALIITISYAISKENLFVSTGLHALNNIYALLEILL